MKPRIAALELDNQLCFALYDASRAFTRAYRPVLDELGLTYPQYLVMLVLWEAEGAQSVGELGDALHLDSGTLTPLLKRLEQQGLIDRVRDEQDERRVLISLSRQGRGLRARAADVPAKVHGSCGVDAKTARALRAELNRIVQALS